MSPDYSEKSQEFFSLPFQFHLPSLPSAKLSHATATATSTDLLPGSYAWQMFNVHTFELLL